MRRVHGASEFGEHFDASEERTTGALRHDLGEEGSGDED